MSHSFGRHFLPGIDRNIQTSKQLFGTQQIPAPLLHVIFFLLLTSHSMRSQSTPPLRQSSHHHRHSHQLSIKTQIVCLLCNSRTQLMHVDKLRGRCYGSRLLSSSLFISKLTRLPTSPSQYGLADPPTTSKHGD
jgi:hypothetical protein